MTVDSLLGIGIYSVPEVARITRVPQDQIRRWLWGYRYTSDGQKIHSPALWNPQIPELEGSKALSFNDLVEVQFVHRFRQEGLSLQLIRRTIEKAKKLLKPSYPLSSVKFKTDGRRILAQVIEEDASENGYAFDLETGQYVLDFVLPYLYDALEYSKYDEILRWWPLGKNKKVVIDPKKSFGRPIVVEGVPTSILANSHKAEGSIKAVARWFDVSESSVKDALTFEREHNRQLAAA